MTKRERKALEDATEKAMRAAGRLPERAVLEILPDSELERVAAYWGAAESPGPFLIGFG